MGKEESITKVTMKAREDLQECDWLFL